MNNFLKLACWDVSCVNRNLPNEPNSNLSSVQNIAPNPDMEAQICLTGRSTYRTELAQKTLYGRFTQHSIERKLN
ncbi:hypothetical protein VF11_37565 [Nostoc linckia z14]|nr:hypothetical protein VF11_37565 [Nostoc linckia z14]PHK14294.1 hypothetical protein VF12_40985 [Nostoc linckia z15]